MSFNRELQDFANTFGMAFSIGDRINQRSQEAKDRKERKVANGTGYQDDPAYKEIQRQIDTLGSTTGTRGTYADGGEVEDPLRRSVNRATADTRKPRRVSPLSEFNSLGPDWHGPKGRGRMTDEFIRDRNISHAADAADKEDRDAGYADGGEVERATGIVDYIFPTKRNAELGDERNERIRNARTMQSATGGRNVSETGSGPTPEPPRPSIRDRYQAAMSVPQEDMATKAARAMNKEGVLPDERAAPVTVKATAPSLPPYDKPRMPTTDVGAIPRKNGLATTPQGVASPGNTSATGGAASPGGSAVSAPSTPGATAPTSATGAVAATAGGRKHLNDQTRTEAFDPNNQQDWNEADNNLREMIKGGLTYAGEIFHLNNPNDPNHASGREALKAGVGAPPAQLMQQVDQAVIKSNPDMFKGPLGMARLQLKRMEVIRQWAMNNGRTEQADKMSFEIMQYAQHVTAQYGQHAAQAVQAGDIAGATQAVANALDNVPDGYKVAAGGDGAIHYYDANGRELKRVQFTPQQLLQTSLGLANGDLYWKMLAERSQRVPGVARDVTATRRAELDATRMETEKLRQAALRQRLAKGSGGGGAAPASPVASILADIRSRIPSSAPRASEPKTPPQGSNDGPTDDEDEPTYAGGGLVSDEDEAEQIGGVVGGLGGKAIGSIWGPIGSMAGGKIGTGLGKAVASAIEGKWDKAGKHALETAIPKFEDGGEVNLRVRKERPVAEPVLTQPIFEGVKDTQPASITPSASPLAPPQMNAPQMQQPSPAQVTATALPPAPKAEPFNEPHPLAEFKGRDPYADLLAGIDPNTGKEDPKLRQWFVTKEGRKDRADIVKEQTYLKNQVREYEQRRKAYEKQNKDNSSVNGPAVKPNVVHQTDQIAQAIGETLSQLPKDQKSTLNDGYVDKNDITDLAMEFASHNAGMSTQRAVDWVGKFINSGNQPTEKDLRNYDVGGWTKDGKYIVLHPKGDDTVGIRVTPDTYKRLERIVQNRWQKRAAETTKEQEDAEKRKKLWNTVLPSGKMKSPFLLY